MLSGISSVIGTIVGIFKPSQRGAQGDGSKGIAQEKGAQAVQQEGGTTIIGNHNIIAGGRLIPRGSESDGIVVTEMYPPEGWVSREISKEIIGRINKYFKGKVEIIRQVSKPPKIKLLEGDFFMSEEDREEAEKMRQYLGEKGRPNDMHVILEGDVDCGPEDVILEVKRIDYASILALRSKGKCPTIVTANVLVVCSEQEMVVLHRRSKDVETDQGKLHVFGGGYMPTGDDKSGGHRASDSGGLKDTAERELQEASTIRAEIKGTPMLLAIDKSCPGIKFFQLNYMFCDISEETCKNVSNLYDAKVAGNADDDYTWEGRPCPYSFAEFFRIIKGDENDTEFAMSGKAHLLVWMALGCPGFDEGKKRTELAKKAQEAFYDIVGYPSENAG